MSFLNHDPVEQTLKYKRVVKWVELWLKLKLYFHPMKKQMGFCFIYWEEKKRYLKKWFNVDWKTPAEMNPDVLFD